MGPYLFAYGTLQTHRAPEEVAPFVARFKRVGEGWLYGRVFDLGSYPGAIVDAASPEKIFGTVFLLPDDPELLRQLDAYEEYDAESPGTSLFVRRLHPVQLAGGRMVTCWVYEYNADATNSGLDHRD